MILKDAFLTGGGGVVKGDQKLELLYFEYLVYTYDSSHTLQIR